MSDFVAKKAIRLGGIQAERVHYVLNCVDATLWKPETDGTSVRDEFEINPSTPVMTTISRLCNWKGHTELLQALARVKETHSDFKLLIVGEDDPRATIGGGSYSDELKALVKELNLGANVIFTGFRKDIMQILAAADFYTMPSFEEPCAVAFIEAMAMKKPVVALDSGGTGQLVDHGKSGLLSEPEDIEQLATNIKVLLDNPQLRRDMGEYARKRVIEYYNPERMTREVEAIYDSLMGKPSRRSGRYLETEQDQNDNLVAVN